MPKRCYREQVRQISTAAPDRPGTENGMFRTTLRFQEFSVSPERCHTLRKSPSSCYLDIFRVRKAGLASPAGRPDWMGELQVFRFFLGFEQEKPKNLILWPGLARLTLKSRQLEVFRFFLYFFCEKNLKTQSNNTHSGF